jgi:SAM-dependent methyltransferase
MSMNDTISRRIPLPPADMIQSIGGGDYDAIGKHVFDLFINHCGLKPNSNVLDIGSGCGRVAVKLLDYLDPPSQYHGFDVVKDMVEWCETNITAVEPRFQFHFADLDNTLYNEASEKASTYRFPFDDAEFDFAFATSVFTHLNIEDSQNYLREIRRVLKPNGKALITFFLSDETYRRNRLNNIGKIANVDFSFGEAPYWVNDPAVPEAICAYDEAFAFDMIRQAGLEIATVSYGGWNHARGWSFQDCIIVTPPK